MIGRWLYTGGPAFGRLAIVTVVELRQYTLFPGARDQLIDLFEAELLEAQEDCGLRIVGTFRDLDDDRAFVWLRESPDMHARTAALHRFYGGPVWRRHREAANATMINSDNVLLLRPAWGETAFALAGERPSRGAGGDPDRGIVEAIILSLREPAGAVDLMSLRDGVAPAIEAGGGAILACLVSEHSENDFPVLPVREGENALACLAAYPSRVTYASGGNARASIRRACADWPGALGPPQILRLAPTRRSLLAGTSASRSTPIHLPRQPGA